MEKHLDYDETRNTDPDSTPPPTPPPPWRHLAPLVSRSGCCLKNSLMRVGFEDVSLRDPGVLLRPIPLPLGQELATPSLVMHLQEFPDCMGQTAIDEAGRRRVPGGGWRADEMWGFRWETWKTGWMRRRGGGRFSRMAVGVIIHVMENGPMKRGASLGLVVRNRMSHVDSYTFCPTRYLGAGRR